MKTFLKKENTSRQTTFLQSADNNEMFITPEYPAEHTLFKCEYILVL